MSNKPKDLTEGIRSAEWEKDGVAITADGKLAILDPDPVIPREFKMTQIRPIADYFGAFTKIARLENEVDNYKRHFDSTMGKGEPIIAELEHRISLIEGGESGLMGLHQVQAYRDAIAIAKETLR